METVFFLCCPQLLEDLACERRRAACEQVWNFVEGRWNDPEREIPLFGRHAKTAFQSEVKRAFAAAALQARED